MCKTRQRISTHEARPQTTEIAFIGLGETREKQLRHQHVEHGVAQEFESLIVTT